MYDIVRYIICTLGVEGIIELNESSLNIAFKRIATNYAFFSGRKDSNKYYKRQIFYCFSAFLPSFFVTKCDKRLFCSELV